MVICKDLQKVKPKITKITQAVQWSIPDLPKKDELHSIVMSCSSKKENGRQWCIFCWLVCCAIDTHILKVKAMVRFFSSWDEWGKPNTYRMTYLFFAHNPKCSLLNLQKMTGISQIWRQADETDLYGGVTWSDYMYSHRMLHFISLSPFLTEKMCYVKHNSFIINTHNYVHVYVCTINKMWSCCFAI